MIDISKSSGYENNKVCPKACDKLKRGLLNENSWMAWIKERETILKRMIVLLDFPPTPRSIEGSNRF